MSRSTDRGNNFSVQSPHGGMRRTALSRTSVEMSTERSGAALLAEALLAEEASATRKPSAAADWTGVDAAYGAARSISQARSLSVASTASSRLRVTEARVRWSLRSVYLVAFLSLMGFTVLLPSLWPRLKAHGASREFFGAALAAYCAGQIIGSISLGWMARGQSQPRAKVFLLLTVLLEAMGYALYVATPNKWAIVASRLLCGLGAGNITICRTYLTAVSEPAEMSGRMSDLTASQALGFLFGPIVGSLCGLLDVPASDGASVFNTFTLPGWVAMVFVLTNFGATAACFVDEPSPDPVVTPLLSGVTDTDGGSESSGPTPETDVPFLLKAAFLGTFYIELVVFSVAEVTLVPTTIAYYGWGVRNNGILWAAAGLVALVPLLSMRRLNALLSDRGLFAIGIALYTVVLLAIVPWNAVAAGPWFDAEVQPPPAWRVAPSFALLIGVAHPLVMVNLLTMFAKVLPPTRRGPLMGALQTSGALGRISGSLLGGWAMDAGTRVTQGLVLVNLGLVVVLLVAAATYWRIAVPKLEVAGAASAAASNALKR